MAKREIITNPKVKKSLEQLENVGKTLINLANLRGLYLEAECDGKIMEIPIQQALDFGCAIDAEVDSLYHHLSEQAPTPQDEKDIPETKPAKPQVRYCLSIDQFDAFNRDLSHIYAIADALNLSFNLGDGPNPENAATLTAMIFEKLFDLTKFFREFGKQKLESPPES